MQQSKAIETWVGLFVALGLIGLFFLALQVSNLSDLRTGEKSYEIKARFQNAGSLKVRAVVSMAGVRLGRVSAIEFDKETYEAIVKMRIDATYDNLPSDTTANILTQGLLGEQYIGLSPGGSPEYLKDGNEIELTQSAMVLEEVISRFLFNKAESGGEKTSSASSADEDEPESTNLAPTPSPKPSVGKAKPAVATHAQAGSHKPSGSVPAASHVHDSQRDHAQGADKHKPQPSHAPVPVK